MVNWKSAPTDTLKNWIGKSLELAILLQCDWECTACSAYSNFHSIAFTRKGTMTLDQIRYFIEQMHDANAYLGRIRILGGEPTIHKFFHEIVKLLHAELVENGHVGFLEVITNGDHMERIAPVKHLFHRVRVSGERDKQKHHVSNMRATPESLGYEGIRCSQPTYCGAQLNHWGFFPCSAGAGIARLTDTVEKYKRVSLPIVGGPDANWNNIQELCNKCLHGLREKDKVKCGTGTKSGQFALNAPSPEVWNHLAPWLQGKQADWDVYGSDKAVRETEGKT